MYTVWEDPAHPNRFYELLVCRQIGVLDHLTAGDGPLARLTEQVEGCRAPDGFFLRRVWLDAEQSSVADSFEYGGPLRSLSRLGRDLR